MVSRTCGSSVSLMMIAGFEDSPLYATLSHTPCLCLSLGQSHRRSTNQSPNRSLKNVKKIIERWIEMGGCVITPFVLTQRCNRVSEIIPSDPSSSSSLSCVLVMVVVVALTPMCWDTAHTRYLLTTEACPTAFYRFFTDLLFSSAPPTPIVT